MANPKCTIKGRFIGGSIFTPDDDKGKYSAVIVLDESSVSKIETIRADSMSEKWKKRPAGHQDWTVREGDDEEFENSFGHMFINPKANKKPKCFTKRKGKLEEVQESDDLIYAGCYVYAVVDAYSYDGSKEKNIKAGTTLGLQHLVFWKHGEPLGYDGNPAEDDYADMESELDDDIDSIDDADDMM